MKTVYIVQGSVCYDCDPCGCSEWIVAAYFDRTKADEHALKAQEMIEFIIENDLWDDKEIIHKYDINIYRDAKYDVVELYVME